jgi:hypothetical protein
MAISDIYASTVILVRVYFGFDEFACDPDEITEALHLQPDELRRTGEFRRLGRDPARPDQNLHAIIGTYVEYDVRRVE